jgi:hypothetical protein
MRAVRSLLVVELTPAFDQDTCFGAAAEALAIEQLIVVSICRGGKGRRRGRVFAYRACLDILNEGTTPLPAV